MIAVKCVDEVELDGDYKKLVGEMLAEAHPSIAGAFRARGWWTLPPVFRCVARDADGVIGQVSAYEIDSRPALRLMGLGDGILKKERRGSGILKLMLSACIEECWERGAEHIIVSTKKHSSMILSLGFAPTRPFRFYYETESACVWRPTWLVMSKVPIAASRVWLAEGHF